MADFGKIKKSRMGAPPPASEASPNLQAPEVAPAPPLASPAAGTAAPIGKAPSRIDGRSLRRTDRTVPFATRVTADFDRRVREIAGRERILIVEVLERALDAYEGHR